VFLQLGYIGEPFFCGLDLSRPVIKTGCGCFGFLYKIIIAVDTVVFEEQQGSRSLLYVEYARPLFIPRALALAYFLLNIYEQADAVMPAASTGRSDSPRHAKALAYRVLGILALERVQARRFLLSGRKESNILALIVYSIASLFHSGQEVRKGGANRQNLVDLPAEFLLP
jgi:hypothetical protein